MCIKLRFSERSTAIIGDISKMYHSVNISEKDQHRHRYLWRDLNISIPFETYVMRVVSFGDKPSGAIVTVALLNTAEMLKNEYPRAYECISKNMYVDDILDSVNTIEEAQSLAADVETVLGKGNFKLKEWVFSGNNDPVIEELQDQQSSREDLSLNVHVVNDDPQKEQKVLGMWWFHFKINLNFSKKKRG